MPARTPSMGKWSTLLLFLLGLSACLCAVSASADHLGDYLEDIDDPEFAALHAELFQGQAESAASETAAGREGEGEGEAEQDEFVASLMASFEEEEVVIHQEEEQREEMVEVEVEEVQDEFVTSMLHAIDEQEEEEVVSEETREEESDQFTRFTSLSDADAQLLALLALLLAAAATALPLLLLSRYCSLRAHRQRIVAALSSRQAALDFLTSASSLESLSASQLQQVQAALSLWKAFEALAAAVESVQCYVKEGADASPATSPGGALSSPGRVSFSGGSLAAALSKLAEVEGQLTKLTGKAQDLGLGAIVEAAEKAATDLQAAKQEAQHLHDDLSVRISVAATRLDAELLLQVQPLVAKYKPSSDAIRTGLAKAFREYCLHQPRQAEGDEEDLSAQISTLIQAIAAPRSSRSRSLPQIRSITNGSAAAGGGAGAGAGSSLTSRSQRERGRGQEAGEEDLDSALALVTQSMRQLQIGTGLEEEEKRDLAMCLVPLMGIIAPLTESEQRSHIASAYTSWHHSKTVSQGAMVASNEASAAQIRDANQRQANVIAHQLGMQAAQWQREEKAAAEHEAKVAKETAAKTAQALEEARVAHRRHLLWRFTVLSIVVALVMCVLELWESFPWLSVDCSQPSPAPSPPVSSFWGWRFVQSYLPVPTANSFGKLGCYLSALSAVFLPLMCWLAALFLAMKFAPPILTGLLILLAIAVICKDLWLQMASRLGWLLSLLGLNLSLFLLSSLLGRRLSSPLASPSLSIYYHSLLFLVWPALSLLCGILVGGYIATADLFAPLWVVPRICSLLIASFS